jgi:hypothetical protein
MELPKNEGGNFEQTPAGTFMARCYRFIDLGSHEQTYQGESKGLKRLVMIGFELAGETMEDGRPFTIHKRYTWSTHEKANMRKDLESWRGAKFNDSDFGEGGFDVRNLLGVPATLTIVHSENDGKNYSNIASIGKAMKGIAMPDAVNAPVYLSLQSDRFDRELFEGLSDKLKAFIAESPEYQKLFAPKTNGASSSYDERNPPPRADRELDDEIPF